MVIEEKLRELREHLASLEQIESSEAGPFDNRPTWDNIGPGFDNRPTWDNI